MACLHKFADDLYLDKLEFTPATLIVGSFNPGWDILGNTAQWFYGRTHNNYFWEVLPRLYGKAFLRHHGEQDWKTFCKMHGLALSDLIFSIEDADSTDANHVGVIKSYRDDTLVRQFNRIIWVDIVQILQNHPAISHVYLTRSLSGCWRQQWEAIEEYCQSRGITTSTLLTPSGSARFQMPRNTNMALVDFILDRWRQKWHLST